MKTAKDFDELMMAHITDNTELILLDKRKEDAHTFVERLKYYYQIKEVEVDFRSYGVGINLSKPNYCINIKANGTALPRAFMFKVYPEDIVIHSTESLPTFKDFDGEFVNSVMNYMNKWFIRTLNSNV